MFSEIDRQRLYFCVGTDNNNMYSLQGSILFNAILEVSQILCCHSAASHKSVIVDSIKQALNGENIMLFINDVLIDRFST